MRFLLDTNAVSEPRRPRPNAGYMRWVSERSADDLALSVLTLGELRRGAARLPDSSRRAALETWIAEAAVFFAERLLPIDAAVAAAWAEVNTRHWRSGRTVGLIDELIAATALSRGLTIVSRNRRDFASSGCEAISPWSS